MNASAETKVEEDASGVEVAVAFVFSILLAIPEGWMLARMWEWFVVPLGVPAIDTFHAVGLDTLRGAFWYRYHDGPVVKPLKRVWMSFLTVGTMTALAYFFHLAM